MQARIDMIIHQYGAEWYPFLSPVSPLTVEVPSGPAPPAARNCLPSEPAKHHSDYAFQVAIQNFLPQQLCYSQPGASHTPAPHTACTPRTQPYPAHQPKPIRVQPVSTLKTAPLVCCWDSCWELAPGERTNPIPAALSEPVIHRRGRACRRGRRRGRTG